MKNVVEFFSDLPEKICSVCRKPIHEQADCYMNECPECSWEKQYKKIS